MKDEALKLALEALEFYYDMHEEEADAKAITAIKEALANDALEKKAENARELGLNYEPEPVAWMKPHEKCDRACMYLCTKGFTQFPECASLQRTWVGLTDEEIADLYFDKFSMGELKAFARAIEAKLKEKNT